MCECEYLHTHVHTHKEREKERERERERGMDDDERRTQARALERFRAEVTCSLCSRVFESPALLPCGCSFCFSCVEARLSGKGRVECSCPSCRQPVWWKECRHNLSLELLVGHFKKLMETIAVHDAQRDAVREGDDDHHERRHGITTDNKETKNTKTEDEEEEEEGEGEEQKEVMKYRRMSREERRAARQEVEETVRRLEEEVKKVSELIEEEKRRESTSTCGVVSEDKRRRKRRSGGGEQNVDDGTVVVVDDGEAERDDGGAARGRIHTSEGVKRRRVLNELDRNADPGDTAVPSTTKPRTGGGRGGRTAEAVPVERKKNKIIPHRGRPLTQRTRLVLASSGLRSAEAEKLRKLSRLKRNGTRSDARVSASKILDPQCTHLIVGVKRNEETERKRYTLKVYAALLRKCRILSYDWVTDSIEQGVWADEEAYRIFPNAGDVGMENNRGDARHVSLSTTTDSRRLFEGHFFHISNASQFKQYADFLHLAQLGGATLLKRHNPALARDGAPPVRVLVPGHASRESIDALAEKWDSDPITLQWLLDSISEQTILPSDAYKA